MNTQDQAAWYRLSLMASCLDNTTLDTTLKRCFPLHQLPNTARHKNKKPMKTWAYMLFNVSRYQPMPNVESLPLNSRRRFAGYIVDDARDAFNFFDDARRNLL